ncbi:hypothetical protein [Bradyrhizobium phage BDU-MI-1]|nr:hypothetical protein [Bradyrhizobium phage BDU-MI-1]
MIRIIAGLFRIRQLLRIEETARRVVADVERHDKKLGGTPPYYNDSKPPDGDDYNEIYAAVRELRETL